MNARSIIPVVIVAASSLLYCQQGAAAVPFVDTKGTPAHAVCPTTTLQVPVIYHFDKIAFQLGFEPQLIAANPVDQKALDALPRNTPLDIKVLDNPRTIADLKAKVLVFLGAAITDANRQVIIVNSVLYATAVCNPKGW